MEKEQIGIFRTFGCGEANVLRIGCQFLDVPEEIRCRFRTIETQSGDSPVIGGRPHGVESGSGCVVVAQIVDGVAPQLESGAAFGYYQLDAPLASRFGTAQI